MAAPVMNAGSDTVLNYSSISGGATSVALTGSATVTSPGSAITTWLWELVQRPTGSSAALSSTSAQNPTLTNVDTIGTYILFLRGTDDAAQSSESDYLIAPSSAWVKISVKTQYSGIEKPAPTQRDWHDEYYGLADEVDGLRNEVDTHIADTTDPHNTLSVAGTVAVSNAPSGSGQIIQSTSTTAAAWATPSAALVPTATTSVLGKAKLAESPFDAANPKIVVKDKLAFTVQVQGTLTASGWTPYEVTEPDAEIGTGGTPSPYCAVFYMPYNFYITTINIMFMDGGSVSGQYDIVFAELTSGNYTGNAAGTVLGSTLNISHSSGVPSVGSATINTQVTAGNYVGIAITRAPGTPGGCMTVQVNGWQVF